MAIGGGIGMVNSAEGVTHVYRDVLALVEYLKATHQPGDLYRGQNRDYPVMSPSFYRSFVTDLSKCGPIAEISEAKFQRAYSENRQSRMRFDILNALIGDFGVGLGNVIAQQYGVTSECVDVTESIDVAAYFATRKYPSYAHISDGATGVIYRFQAIGADQPRGPLSLHDMSGHFEAGKSKAGFYDFLVHDGEHAARVFDRDKWWLYQSGDESVVWSLRFATSWSELRQILDRQKWWEMHSDPRRYLGSDGRPFDWALTRFQSQLGGLIRPRHYWRARVPSRFELAANGREAVEIRMRGMIGPRFDPGPDDRGRWPLVIPSAAIKRDFIGVENLRADPNCQVFLFEHGKSRITGFYRRKLWPEPSEDPLYGALWRLGASQLFKAYGWSDSPAVDDAAEGLFDRGYRLDAEAPTTDGRAEADLMQCQAEDAAENIAFGTPTERDYLHAMTPQIVGGNAQIAARSAIRGLRLAPDNPDLLQGLSQCFEMSRKPRWAERTLARALSIAPDNPWLLYRRAMSLARRAQIAEASNLLDRAIELYDAGIFEFSDFFLLELRLVLAWAIGDYPNVQRVRDLMKKKHYGIDDVIGQVRYFLRNHPHLIDIMQERFARFDDPKAKFLCEIALEGLCPATDDA